MDIRSELSCKGTTLQRPAVHDEAVDEEGEVDVVLDEALELGGDGARQLLLAHVGQVQHLV